MGHKTLQRRLNLEGDIEGYGRQAGVGEGVSRRKKDVGDDRAVWEDTTEPGEEKYGSESEHRVRGVGSQEVAQTGNLDLDYRKT